VPRASPVASSISGVVVRCGFAHAIRWRVCANVRDSRCSFLTGPAYDAGSNVLTLFQVVFMETAGYIIVGAICERITFGAFLLCELFVGAILYPVFIRVR